MSTGTRVNDLNVSVQSESGVVIPASLVSRCTSVRDYTVTVPAGKTVLQVLDDRTCSAVTEPVFTMLVSDTPGVTFWPVDEASPTVDPDTEQLGWITAFEGASTYEHEHGDTSNDPHVGTVVNYETLPCWAFVKEDRLAAEGVLYWRQYMQEMNPPDTTISRPGSLGVNGAAADAESMALKVDALTASSAGRRAWFAMYYRGMTDYLNLGSATDGLRLWSYIYSPDPTYNDIVSMQLFNYPFFSGMTEPLLVPINNPAGEAVWAADDRNLCLDGIGGAGLGWMTAHSGGSNQSLAAGNSACFYRGSPDTLTGYAAQEAAYNPSLATGWNVYCHGPKSEFIEGPADPAAAGNVLPGYVSQRPIWSRVTAMLVGFISRASGSHPISGDSWKSRYIGTALLPKNPRYPRALKSVEVNTEKPWAVGSKPSVAFQNWTGKDAIVKVTYGTSR